jgi:putative hemolysin
LDAADQLLALGNFVVYCAAACQLPNVMREIGRLREMSFRAVGEGTGKAFDLDEFDPHYRHLFVWNKASSEIVGAYRLASTQELIACRGVSALYTHSLLEFDASLFDRIGPSLEMGRSFVNPAWQGNNRVLRLLWAGIAVLLDRSPQIRHLFGPVSVSPRYSDVGKFLIITALQLHHMDADLKSLVRPRNALQIANSTSQQRLIEISAGLADPCRLSKFLQRIEHGLKLPMLIRHYIELKGRFAGFSVDHAFNGTLDGLVFVRVEDIGAKMRSRLIGSGTT